MVEEAQDVGQQAHDREAAEHDVERSSAGVVGAAAGRRKRDPGDPDHDRRHREMLTAACTLAQHPLAHDHQHEQACGERRLHDHERRVFEGDHLQRPAEHGQPCAEQPASASEQPRGEREPQVRVRGRLLGVHRLKRDPYAVEDRGADRREQPKDEIDHECR